MWVYKIVNGQLTEDDINALGAQGWELVTIIGNVQYYFKKPA